MHKLVWEKSFSVSGALLLSLLGVSRNGLVERSQLFLMGDNKLGIHLDSRDPECRAFYLSSSAS